MIMGISVDRTKMTAKYVGIQALLVLDAILNSGGAMDDSDCGLQNCVGDYARPIIRRVTHHSFVKNWSLGDYQHFSKQINRATDLAYNFAKHKVYDEETSCIEDKLTPSVNYRFDVEYE